MVRRLLLFLFLTCSLPLAAAQKDYVTSLLAPPKWQLTASSQVSLQDLAKWGENPAVDLEFGAASAVQRTYQKGDTTVTAYFEKAADASSAYGLFTFYQDPAMHPARDVQLAVVGRAGALLARGLYFIRVIRPSNPGFSEQDLRELLTTIAGSRLSAENVDSLPAPLPRRGMIPGTQRYILGPEAAKSLLPSFPVNLIGFEDGVEAHLGVYRAGRGRLTLLAISYPTPQLARLRYHAIASALRVNQLLGPRSVYGRQKGSYAILVLDAGSRQAADQFLSQLNVSQTVTYSPHSPPGSSEARQLVLMVLGDLELVFIVAVCGLISGVTVFLCKLLIMRVFPHWALARARDRELIRLKLG